MKISRCGICGVDSVPHFGMFRPCAVSETGRHGDIYSVTVDDATVGMALWGAYQNVSWFDRENFDRYASSEMMSLLQYGCLLQKADAKERDLTIACCRYLRCRWDMERGKDGKDKDRNKRS